MASPTSPTSLVSDTPPNDGQSSQSSPPQQQQQPEVTVTAPKSGAKKKKKKVGFVGASEDAQDRRVDRVDRIDQIDQTERVDQLDRSRQSSPPAEAGDYFSLPIAGDSRNSTPGTGRIVGGNRDDIDTAELTSALQAILSPEHHAGPPTHITLPPPLSFPRPALRKPAYPDGPAEPVERSEVEARHRANELASGLASRTSIDTDINTDIFGPTDDTVALIDAIDTHDPTRLDRAGTRALDGDAQGTLRHRRDHDAAADIVRRFSKQGHSQSRATAPITSYHLGDNQYPPSGMTTGTTTPVTYDTEYVPKPSRYHGGILSMLLKLQEGQSREGSSTTTPNRTPNRTPAGSPPDSTPSTPRPAHHKSSLSKGYSKGKGGALAELIGSSATLASTSNRDFTEAATAKLKAERPKFRKRHSSSFFSSAKAKENEIIKHVASIISRHRYLVKLCRALMLFGAPTHRLESYMMSSARVLKIEAQFLYLPGCMIISFDDSDTHTTEVRIVREPAGVDLGRLHDVHDIYKHVVHDVISVDEAMTNLTDVMSKKDKYSKWVRIAVYGFAAATVAPFGFGGRWVDLPIAFILGCILGLLQVQLAPRSDTYHSVFEVSAALVTSFLARMFGSIQGGSLFCFSALAQASIALILPGYMVLCSSLELQSHNLVAGSVRMVYAMIYTLFLGYGITIGSAIYGFIDENATSQTTCSDSLDSKWYPMFVILFTLCLCVINQAKWRQVPVMLTISVAGYVVNSYSNKGLNGASTISNTLGAVTIGVLANLYSRSGGVQNKCIDCWERGMMVPVCQRIRNVFTSKGKKKQAPSMYQLKAMSDPESGVTTPDEKPGDGTSITRKVGYSLAAAAMMPAIFVQVPSGLASTGSLISGIQSANNITHSSDTTSTSSSTTDLNSGAFTVLLSVIQVAISISVGLSLSAVLVYPIGKRGGRSGLLSL